VLAYEGWDILQTRSISSHFCLSTGLVVCADVSFGVVVYLDGDTMFHLHSFAVPPEESKHNPILPSFMTYHRILNKSNTKGAISGTETYYISGTSEFTLELLWCSCCSIVSFQCSVLYIVIVCLFVHFRLGLCIFYPSIYGFYFSCGICNFFLFLIQMYICFSIYNLRWSHVGLGIQGSNIVFMIAVLIVSKWYIPSGQFVHVSWPWSSLQKAYFCPTKIAYSKY
jgi:hypothetical protein